MVEPVNFQTNEGADGEADVVALGTRVPRLAALDAGVLFETSVVLLYPTPAPHARPWSSRPSQGRW
jgi:hypothetical protein